jgi:hypothetical protein
MRWVLYIGAAIALIALLVVVIGAMLPKAHSVSRTARIPLPPDALHARIMQQISEPQEYPLRVDRNEPPSLVVTRIVGEKLPFGGTWTYRIAAASGGSDDQHRGRRGLQSGVSIHVALRLRPLCNDGRLLGESEGAVVKDDKCFVSTRSRIEKLGVKEGSDVLLLGIESDEAFVKELRSAGAAIRTIGSRPADMIFATFAHRDDLRRLPPLVARLTATGALWTLRPKGSKDLTESEMMRAGQAAGLADVKVVSFSDVLTAEKFVIPVAKRSAIALAAKSRFQSGTPHESPVVWGDPRDLFLLVACVNHGAGRQARARGGTTP